MSEEKPQGVTSALRNWIKALLTSVVGLVSGAFIMYLTPVVNNAIKPAKPVANFAAQATGLTVNFNNRSTGGVQGWWDYGDGSALEPFDPKIENVKHVFAKPGAYSVKLSLQNLLGDDSERTATVTIDADVDPTPSIDLFQVESFDKREVAPAIYKLQSKVKNASFCILSSGDERPTEVIDAAAGSERYISFEKAGTYTIRLAAISGKQLVEKTQTVRVGAGDSNDPMAKLLVSYQAIRVNRSPPKDWHIHCGWQADATGSTSAFRKERLAEPGSKIVSAELTNKDDNNATVRNLSLVIAPDKSKITLTGELVRQAGVPTAPHFLAQVQVVTESRSAPQTINRGSIAMTVKLNSTTKLPLHALGDGWEIVRTDMKVQLWDGANKSWEGNGAVSGARVMLKNQNCLVTTIPQKDGVLLKIEAPSASPGLGPIELPAPVALPAPLVSPAPVAQPELVIPTIRKASFEYDPLRSLRPMPK